MMSGFNDDIIAILKDNTLFHVHSVGCVCGSVLSRNSRAQSLLSALRTKGLLVSRKMHRSYLYDYIIIPKEQFGAKVLLKALSKLGIGGIIIVEVGENSDLESRYVSLFGNFTATTVVYEGRKYLVLHSGVDYGN